MRRSTGSVIWAEFVEFRDPPSGRFGYGWVWVLVRTQSLATAPTRRHTRVPRPRVHRTRHNTSPSLAHTNTCHKYQTHHAAGAPPFQIHSPANPPKPQQCGTTGGAGEQGREHPRAGAGGGGRRHRAGDEPHAGLSVGRWMDGWGLVCGVFFLMQRHRAPAFHPSHTPHQPSVTKPIHHQPTHHQSTHHATHPYILYCLLKNQIGGGPPAGSGGVAGGAGGAAGRPDGGALGRV